MQYKPLLPMYFRLPDELSFQSRLVTTFRFLRQILPERALIPKLTSLDCKFPEIFRGIGIFHAGNEFHFFCKTVNFQQLQNAHLHTRPSKSFTAPAKCPIVQLILFQRADS